jgi:hypothetical protein
MARVLIHFYVPALIPRLDRNEAALRLSEIVHSFLTCMEYTDQHISSARRAARTHDIWGVSFLYKVYKVGTRTELSGTAAWRRHFSLTQFKGFVA